MINTKTANTNDKHCKYKIRNTKMQLYKYTNTDPTNQIKQNIQILFWCSICIFPSGIFVCGKIPEF